MRNILVVLGTRPEAIKLAPIILALKNNRNYNVVVCNTEQQKELSNQTLNFFGLSADINLDVMTHNQTLSQLQTNLLNKLQDLLQSQHFDATIVQGDTMTVFCAALVSFYNKIPVFHVEAGLRSKSLFEPFPEEAIRQMVSRIVDLHFCPTLASKKALERETLLSQRFFETGNTVIDALSCIDEAVLKDAYNTIHSYGIQLNRKVILVTAHRRENHGERLNKIIDSIVELSSSFNDIQFVIPVHPNPNVKNKVHERLRSMKNIYLLPPLPYPELVLLMKNSTLIMTDSGGIQEEAPTFGCPILVLRYETERKEGVDAGFAKLVGADTKMIVESAKEVIEHPSKYNHLKSKTNPYGDGFATQRIIETIDEYFNTK